MKPLAEGDITQRNKKICPVSDKVQWGIDLFGKYVRLTKELLGFIMVFIYNTSQKSWYFKNISGKICSRESFRKGGKRNLHFTGYMAEELYILQIRKPKLFILEKRFCINKERCICYARYTRG